MTEMALTVRGLCKAYPRFRLEDVSLNVPRGTVVGLIGENGAGKSTLISAALGLVKRDAGAVSVLGKEMLDAKTLGQVGVVFDGNNFPDVLSPAKLGRVLSRIYPSWDEPGYAALLERLGVPPDQKLSEMSKGTRTKLSIVTALSHGSRLLVLDEPTSGLDPVVRDDILDLLWDFVQDEQNAVLISSHITSDLEKVADYIVFLNQGRVVFEKPKDELRYRWGMLRCGAERFRTLDPADLVAWRQQDYEYEALVYDREAAHKKYPDALIDPATIDEIMLMHIRGKSHEGPAAQGLLSHSGRDGDSAAHLCRGGGGACVSDLAVQSDRSTQWVLYLLLCALGMALGLAVGAIAAALGRAPDPEELYLYASTAVIVCLMTGSVNLPCTFVLTAEKSLAGIILCDILVSALFAGGIFALRQVMDVKLHMRTVLGLGAALSALCYGISWIIAARRLPMRDR